MSHATATSTGSVRHVLGRAFGGRGGVIEPGQKTIIIAVLLGMIVGAILSDGKVGPTDNALVADNASTVPVAVLPTD